MKCLSPEYKKIINILKNDISKDDFIQRYPLYEKNLDNLFSNIIDFNEFNISYYDVKPLLNKLSNFISNILKKESNENIHDEIKEINNFSNYWTYKNLNDINFYKSINDISKIIPSSLIVEDNYIDEKIKDYLFEEIKKNPQKISEIEKGKNISNYLLDSYTKEFKIKKREFENKEFLLKNKIAIDVFDIIKEPTYNYENDVEELFSLEQLDKIDIKYLFKTEIEGKKLKELYDDNLELAKENVYKMLYPILEDNDYERGFWVKSRG